MISCYDPSPFGDRISPNGLHQKRIFAAQASRGCSAEFIYRIIENSIDQLDLRGDVLDFGAGVGTLTRRLAVSCRFANVVAADIMRRPDSIDRTVEWVRCDLNEKTEFDDAVFDLIVAAEIIEHLENPRSVAREWARLLRPAGTLILSTPNNESWRAILSLVVNGCFAAFNDYCYPAHITPLLRTDVRRLLREANFEEPSFFFSNVGSLPKLGRVTWQAMSFGVLRGLRYSDNMVAISRLGPTKTE